MKVYEAPDKTLAREDEKSLLLAGGITNCPNWQRDMISLLRDDLVIYNPLREHYSLENPNIEEEQIIWEFERLRIVPSISFWFSGGSVCPITLYELGMWGNSRKKNVFIGIDPKYPRKKDVEIQTRLSRPEIKIVYSIEDLATQVNSLI